MGVSFFQEMPQDPQIFVGFTGIGEIPWDSTDTEVSQQEALAEQLGAPEGNVEMTAENFKGNFMNCGKLPFFLREF